MSTAETGAWGENTAVKFLEKNGYEIIARNFRARFGEIDIIAWHAKPHFGKTLCFVEVKTRSGEKGSAERATDWKKQKRIQMTAKSYCQKYKIQIANTPIQFEQVSVYIRGTFLQKPEITLYTVIPDGV